MLKAYSIVSTLQAGCLVGSLAAYCTFQIASNGIITDILQGFPTNVRRVTLTELIEY